MSTLIATVLLIGCGLGTVRLIWGGYPLARLGPVGILGLASLAGATVIGLWTTYVGVTGLSTRPWPFVAPVVAAGTLVALVPQQLMARVPWARTRSHSRPDRAVLVADLAVLAATVVVGVVLLAGVSKRLVCCNDEYAIWAIKARTLSLGGHLDPAVFAGAHANYQHLDYPLLQPSVIAWGDGVSGHLNDTAAHTLLVVVLLGALLTLGTALNRAAGPLAGLTAALLAAGTTGVLAPFGLQLTSDVPLAAFSIALFGLAAEFVLRPDRRLIATAALIAAGAAATKVEGALFALSVLIATCVAARGRARRDALLAIAAVVASMLPWQAWTHAHHIRSDLVNGTTLSISHIRKVVPYSGAVIRHMVSYWPGYGWIAVAAAPVAALVLWQAAPHARRLVAFAAIAWTIATVGMWAQYVISAAQHPPTPIGTELSLHFASSAPRVLIVPSLLLVLATPLLAGAALSARAPQPARNASPDAANAAASESRHGGMGVSPAARQAASDSTE